MKKVYKRMFAFLACAAILLLVFGIWQRSWKETVLEFGMFTGSYWDVESANSFRIIDKAIRQFEDTHPGVRVHYYSGISKEDYSEWFSRKVLVHEEPDVFMVLGEDFNQFASLGIMKGLNQLIKKDEDFQRDRYFASTFEAGQYGDVQYSLPYETVPTLMFVNKTLLMGEGIEMPGHDWSWDDFYTICEKVTKDLDGDGILDQFGVCHYSWIDAVCSNGGVIFEPDGLESCFGDPKIVDAVKFISRLEQINQGQKVMQDDFNAGNVAFMPLTFAEYRTYKTYPYKIKRYANFQWDCVSMPAGEQGGNLSRVDTLLIGISANTRYERLAWEFLKLLTYDEEVQMDIFRYSQGASVLKAVTESKKMEEIMQQNMEKGDTVISGSLLGKVIETGYIEPKLKKYEQAMSIANNEIKDILENDKTVDRSLKILQRMVNDYLKQ